MSDGEKRTRTSKWKKQQGKDARRDLKQKVKTARGRKLSSTRWLQRQLNDPFVQKAQDEGYRSRAAYKIAEIDERFHFLKKGVRVLDLGAAPGGWTQIAAERLGTAKTPGDPSLGHVLAVDLQDMEPITGATCIKLDFMDDAAPQIIKDHLGGPVDVLISDMASPATGHKQTDHMRIMALCETAFDFAFDVLTPGGVFVAKVLQGGTEHALLARMRQHFKSVRHFKPQASRADSSEMYVVALAFKGLERPQS